MQDSAQFRQYADECRRLARTLPPAQQQTLLEIAEAWVKCAEETERAQEKGKR